VDLLRDSADVFRPKDELQIGLKANFAINILKGLIETEKYWNHEF
jgi:hypothetical protein